MNLRRPQGEMERSRLTIFWVHCGRCRGGRPHSVEWTALRGVAAPAVPVQFLAMGPERRMRRGGGSGVRERGGSVRTRRLGGQSALRLIGPEGIVVLVW